MATEDTIRTLTLKAQTEGVDEASASLNKLADAQGVFAVESEQASKSALDASASLDRMQRSLDPAYRSAQQLANAQNVLQKAQAQGLVTLAEYNNLMDLAAKKYAVQPVNQFAGALSGVKMQLVGMAAGLGPVGIALAGFGPWGLAAALGLGAAKEGFDLVTGAADKLTERARDLLNFSLVVGMSMEQIEALSHAAESLGMNSEKVKTSIERFTVNLDALRNASGPLYDGLMKVDSGLVSQLASAKNTAEALTIFATATAKAGDAQNAMQRAAFGRGGLEMSLLTDFMNAKGGIDGTTAAMAQFSGISEDTAKKLKALQGQIDLLHEHSFNVFASMFSVADKQLALEKAEQLDAITMALLRLKTARDQASSQSWSDWFAGFKGVLSEDSLMFNAPKALPGTGSMGQAAGVLALADANRAATTTTKELADATENHGFTAAGVAKQYKELMAVLGGAATTEELLRAKSIELNAVVGPARAGIDRAKEFYAVQLAGSDLQIKVQNGVATASELYAQKQRELAQDVSRGKLTQDEATVSLIAYQKAIEQTVIQMEVFKSALPGLKRLELESMNLRGNLDTLGTSIANGISTDLVDMMTHAKTASDAFKDMGLVIIKAIDEMVVKMLFTAPIAKMLQSTLGGFLGGGASPAGGDAWANIRPQFAMGGVFDSGRVTAFAGGGIVTSPTLFPMADGAGLMAEAGPEAVMPLAHTADGKLGVRAQGGSGGDIHVNFSIDARGAERGTAAEIVARAKAEIIPQIIPLVVNAKSRRVRGL